MFNPASCQSQVIFKAVIDDKWRNCQSWWIQQCSCQIFTQMKECKWAEVESNRKVYTRTKDNNVGTNRKHHTKKISSPHYLKHGKNPKVSFTVIYLLSFFSNLQKLCKVLMQTFMAYLWLINIIIKSDGIKQYKIYWYFMICCSGSKNVQQFYCHSYFTIFVITMVGE